MTTRRELIAGAALAPMALALNQSVAAEHHPKGDKNEDAPQFLFVQSAEGVTFSDGRLTLTGVSPITVLFSDRPDRLAGHMTTASFVPFWDEGDNSFASDPPNANLSVLDGDAMQDIVVELRSPRLTGSDLSYEVSVLEGELPAVGGPASLFIDIIGRPLTPISFAGANRRMWRRRAFYR
ncbi:hypothetical protein ThimaDRAFT_2107 [Thiocapsa marina 5811]|uniref:Uncharacterized protein n=2 Tax=Thiocapsa marina TaxID=244573 RepID=F9UB71_9GAMM|nr:hypothetical protein ThimaDRAFT_2107 [Thiocapsa marina 5811]